MKRFWVVLVVLLVLVGCTTNGEKSQFKVGILQWTNHPALDDAREGLVAELKDYDMVYKNANDDASNANMMLAQMLDEGVDLIYAIATPAAQVASSQTDIPVVFNAVTDAVAAGLVSSNEAPSANVTGVSDMAPIDRQLALIKEFLPKAISIGVLFNTSEDNSLRQIEMIESLIDKHGLNLNVQGITSPQEIAIATEALAIKSDALYIITDNMVASATSQVVNVANEHNIPVFMAEGGQFEHGILASDSISYEKLGKQAAAMVKKILEEEVAIADIPVEISEDTELLVSDEVAKLLGIEIPESILERASK